MSYKSKFFLLVADIRSRKAYKDYFNNQESFVDKANDEVVNYWFRTIKMILEFPYESEEQYRYACSNAENILGMLDDYANKKQLVV